MGKGNRLYSYLPQLPAITVLKYNLHQFSGTSVAIDSTQPCPSNACTFPNPSCCAGYMRTSVNGVYTCASNNTTTSPPVGSPPVVTTQSPGTDPTTESPSGNLTWPLNCNCTTPCDCVPGGIWSDWTYISMCNDTCGGCGFQAKRRRCLSGSNCPCR